MQTIAAGSFSSFAITDDGALYGWGEAKMGQLGLGKIRSVRVPTQIQFPCNEEDGSAVQVKSITAGYGHAAALSQQGDLYTWGFNVYGQVGHSNKKTVWYPERLEMDVEGNPMP